MSPDSATKAERFAVAIERYHLALNRARNDYDTALKTAWERYSSEVWGIHMEPGP